MSVRVFGARFDRSQFLRVAPASSEYSPTQILRTPYLLYGVVRQTDSHERNRGRLRPFLCGSRDARGDLDFVDTTVQRLCRHAQDISASSRARGHRSNRRHRRCIVVRLHSDSPLLDYVGPGRRHWIGNHDDDVGWMVRNSDAIRKLRREKNLQTLPLCFGGTIRIQMAPRCERLSILLESTATNRDGDRDGASTETTSRLHDRSPRENRKASRTSCPVHRRSFAHESNAARVWI